MKTVRRLRSSRPSQNLRFIGIEFIKNIVPDWQLLKLLKLWAQEIPERPLLFGELGSSKRT